MTPHWERFLSKLRARPGEWMLAGKGLSAASVESLRETGADVVTHKLETTNRGRPIFDVMARWRSCGNPECCFAYAHSGPCAPAPRKSRA